MTVIRLNKYLAQIGVASRRKIDEITSACRITINGKTAILGDKVNPDTDTIIVDKKIIPPSPPAGGQQLVYYLLYKPKYVLSTSSDDRGRDTVLNYVPKSPRVFAVGRLDYESTGLILLTNDGDLSLRLTHPRYHLPKTYLLTFVGKITPDKVDQFRHGVVLDPPAGGKTAPADVEILPSKFNQGQLQITLYQGKKRQVRRMASTLHLHTVDLHRISLGPLKVGDLSPGEYRPLTIEEIKALKK
jgi:23S rRNA pseudouridine2605 synthase